MRVKICGITEADQAIAIARLGATALGFICVPASPRYVTPEKIQTITRALQTSPETPSVQRIGVFVDAPLDQMCRIAGEANLTGLQLHGSEPPEDCSHLRRLCPEVEVIKALRLRGSKHNLTGPAPDALQAVEPYQDHIDTLLLDAFHPQAYGGTGQTLDWTMLQGFRPRQPWFLAGGLAPHNVAAALAQLQPDGIDLSSGVEQSPGQKDLSKVAQLFRALASRPGDFTQSTRSM